MVTSKGIKLSVKAKLERIDCEGEEPREAFGYLIHFQTTSK